MTTSDTVLLFMFLAMLSIWLPLALVTTVRIVREHLRFRKELNQILNPPKAGEVIFVDFVNKDRKQTWRE